MGRVILDRRQLSLEYVTNCLLVRSPDQPPRTLPLVRMQQLVCLHSVQITTQLIGQLLKRGIDFIVINQRHADNGFSLFADQQRDATRRSVQYQWQSNEAQRLAWAKRLIQHKLKVTQQMLTTGSDQQTLALRSSLARSIKRAREVANEAELRGVEGAAQKAVFAWWRHWLPEELGFTHRQRRPPPDPVNAALSLAYVMTHDEAVRQLKAVGLDPQLGLYHRLSSGRQSLACDLMEPLRPAIEVWVMSLFQKGTLDRRHFSPAKQPDCWLGKQGRALFYAQWHEAQRDWRKRLARYARILAKAVDHAGSVKTISGHA